MKKALFKKITILVFICLFCIFGFAPKATVSAASNVNGVPYTTYTKSVHGLSPTQTAYIPVGVICDSANTTEISKASDIFYYENSLYIADTGNNRIVQTDIKGNTLKVYKHSEFVSPTGVFVTEEGIYIADKGAKTVFKVSHEVSNSEKNTAIIELKVVKPVNSQIFGKQDFVPTKVAVKSNRNIYVIGEGSTNGIIEFNYNGEFLGYLGINSVEQTWKSILYEKILKIELSGKSKPSAPTNVALGLKGSILSTNVNVAETFKRLNITGINTLQATTQYPTCTLSDIIMNDEGYIYMVGEQGDVYEYDSKGNLLFYFNTYDFAQTKSLGLTSKPSGICIDSIGNIYILDSSYSNIQIYQKTVFVDLVHTAVSLYNDGLYEESKPYWEEIQRQNTAFSLAHTALGSALSKEGKYEEALHEFELAKDYAGYSQAYWEIRNAAIQSNLPLWIGLICGAVILLVVLKKVYQKSPAFDGVKAGIAKFKSKKLVSELLYGFKVFKKPSDTFYGIKKQGKASYLSGIILLALFVLVYLIDIYCSGFLFRTEAGLSYVSVQLAIVLGIFLLFVVVNYFVSTLGDGEGWFKDIFICTAYALMPFIVLTLPMTLLSHFLTYNESFLVEAYKLFTMAWTLFLVIYAIKEVHNYSFKKTIGSVLIIIFGMIMLVLIGLLVYSFMGQLIEFLVSIVKEVFYRAF